MAFSQILAIKSPIVSKSKSKGYNPQKMKKFALNSQLQPYQMLTNDDQMLILCLYYFITTVSGNSLKIEDMLEITIFYLHPFFTVIQRLIV